MRAKRKIKEVRVALPSAEFKATGKKSKKGNEQYKLFINGNTHVEPYILDQGMLYGPTHRGKFAQSILNLHCKQLPKDAWVSLETDSKLLKGFMRNDGNVSMSMENNKFKMDLFIDTYKNEKEYFFVDINKERLLEDVMKELKENSKEKLEFDSLDGLLITITGAHDETIQEVLDKLVMTVKKAVMKCKVHWMKEAKQLLKDIESAQ